MVLVYCCIGTLWHEYIILQVYCYMGTLWHGFIIVQVYCYMGTLWYRYIVTLSRISCYSGIEYPGCVMNMNQYRTVINSGGGDGGEPDPSDNTDPDRTADQGNAREVTHYGSYLSPRKFWSDCLSCYTSTAFFYSCMYIWSIYLYTAGVRHFINMSKPSAYPAHGYRFWCRVDVNSIQYFLVSV